MTQARLEHVNVTVSNPAATAKRLCDWFGWQVRWSGPAKNGGTTYHVGNDYDYVALYALATPTETPRGRLNHIGVLVEDLADAERGSWRTVSGPIRTRIMSQVAGSISMIPTGSSSR